MMLDWEDVRSSPDVGYEVGLCRNGPEECSRHESGGNNGGGADWSANKMRSLSGTTALPLERVHHKVPSMGRRVLGVRPLCMFDSWIKDSSHITSGAKVFEEGAEIC